MLTKKGIVIALACTLALGAWSGSALATPVTVDGVHWNTDNPMDLTIQSLSLRETSVDSVGDVLTGYGKIAQINQAGPSEFCPGCDLTFTFMYTVSNINGNQVVFNDGTLNFFVDDSQSYDALDPTTAGIGTPWLSLTGHAAPRAGFTAMGQLYSTLAGSVGNPALGSSGFGYLDVTGGPAQMYTDTNAISDGNGGWADFSLNSSFQIDGLNPCAGGLCYPILGQGGMVGKSAVAVPEPAEAGLLGLGLGVLGLFLWWRRKETEGRQE